MTHGAGARILLVEDDAAIARAVRRSLEAHGYRVNQAADGQAARGLVEGTRPDVILLDLMLPDVEGLDLCRELRELSRAPIIVLSAIHDEADKVEALDAGADDYVTKPFGMAELHARIRVALRNRLPGATGPVLSSGLIVIDTAAHTVTVDGRLAHLTPKEFELCRLLVQNEGRVLTQRYILSQVWGAEYQDDAHILRTFVHQLRSKLAAVSAKAAGQLVTEPGVGYRMVHVTTVPDAGARES
jgi:two-component system KDP operon response regulator KdpE